jgi:hypothetical protein
MSLVLGYNWHETAVFTKHNHILLTGENSLKYSAWQLSFAFSCKWCWENIKNVTDWVPYNGRQRTRFFSPNVNSYTGYTCTIRSTGVFGQGICAKACKRRWLCVEIFIIIRNVVTKADSMELNKRYKYLNCIMAIPAMLCYLPCIIECNVSVRNEGSLFQNEIITLRIHSGQFENSTVMRYTSNCFLM